MGIMTRNLQPSTPFQYWARKQIEFQTIQNKCYESEAIPKPPLNLTLLRQLRSRTDIGQFHTNGYTVTFLLSSLDLTFNLSSVKCFLYGAYHFISNIKYSRRD